MTLRSSRLGPWCGVVLFAVAMAWVESAVVLYLRTLSQHFDPYEPDRVPLTPDILRAELVRELATLLMLGSVGWLAGQTWRGRAALAVLAFGVWDICYYVFLVPLTGWPCSVWDWDILFLLPLPWWGPVLAPVSIASLMVVGGTLVALRDTREQPFWPGRRTWLPVVMGVVRPVEYGGGILESFLHVWEAVVELLPVGLHQGVLVLALAVRWCGLNIGCADIGLRRNFFFAFAHGCRLRGLITQTLRRWRGRVWRECRRRR